MDQFNKGDKVTATVTGTVDFYDGVLMEITYPNRHGFGETVTVETDNDAVTVERVSDAAQAGDVFRDGDDDLWFVRADGTLVSEHTTLEPLTIAQLRGRYGPLTRLSRIKDAA